jgi:rubrerythrin
VPQTEQQIDDGTSPEWGLAADGLDEIHALAERSGHDPTIAAAAAAAATIVELLEERTAVAAVEAVRRDPETHAAALAAALEAAASNNPPLGWVWIKCDKCKKWRLVTAAYCKERGFDLVDVGFSCAEDAERRGASCEQPAEQPADWPSSTDSGGSDGEPMES